MISIYPEKRLKLKFEIEKDINTGYAPFKLGLLSSEKIRTELKWNAKYSIIDGFKRTIEFLKSK